MFSQELITEENPYGLLPREENPEKVPNAPPERPADDPYYPDPYA